MLTISLSRAAVILFSLVSSLFLADRTNGRAYATVLRLPIVVVCDVMYCG